MITPAVEKISVHDILLTVSRAWRNGRRARFRFWCSWRAGSSPVARTKMRHYRNFDDAFLFLPRWSPAKPKTIVYREPNCDISMVLLSFHFQIMSIEWTQASVVYGLHKIFVGDIIPTYSEWMSVQNIPAYYSAFQISPAQGCRRHYLAARSRGVIIPAQVGGRGNRKLPAFRLHNSPHLAGFSRWTEDCYRPFWHIPAFAGEAYHKRGGTIWRKRNENRRRISQNFK